MPANKLSLKIYCIKIIYCKKNKYCLKYNGYRSAIDVVQNFRHAQNTYKIIYTLQKYNL